MEAYTIAFGIRNCTHIDRVIKEAHRVLIPGGRFLCLEFSHVSNPFVKQSNPSALSPPFFVPLLNDLLAYFPRMYDTYSFNMIPLFGEMIASDRASYQYLVESIRKFPDQKTFAGMIENAGFKHVAFEDLTFGVAAIHSGFKL